MISVGVDIGSYSIKIAEVESSSKSYQIRRFDEFPLSLDLTKDKKIEIIDILRTHFSHYNLDKTTFVFALPQSAISSRWVQFPFRERFKIQKSVAAQLEDDLPFSQEDAIFDTKVIRFVGKAADVIAMAAPKERIAEVVGTANDCGVEPKIISGESLALANLIESWFNPPAETVALAEEVQTARPAEIVLNIGHRQSQLLVFCDRTLLAIRNIDWGARNIADTIALQYSINSVQAMLELKSKGAILLDKSAASREHVAFSQTIEKSVDELIGQARLKMLELQSEMNLTWTQGWLSGGPSLLRNLGGYLTQAFSISFNRMNPFEMQPGVNFEVTPQIESASGVALGLAIEGLKRPRNPAVNFLKGEFAQQSQIFTRAWEKWSYTAQLAGVAFVMLLAFGIIRQNLSETLIEQSDVALKVQAEAVAGLKGAKASSSNVQKFLNNVDKQAKSRKSAARITHMNSALDILNKITVALPTNQQIPLEIKRVTVEAETAEVQGYCNSQADKARIQESLKKVSADGRIDLTTARIPVPAGKFEFGYKFKIQRFAGGG